MQPVDNHIKQVICCKETSQKSYPHYADWLRLIAVGCNLRLWIRQQSFANFRVIIVGPSHTAVIAS